MTEKQQLRIAFTVLAHVFAATTATLADLAQYIPEEKLRIGALKDFDEQAESARRIAAMFPPDSIPPEQRDLIFH